MRNIAFSVILLFSIVFLIFHCTSKPNENETAGNTETENVALRGRLLDIKGNPVPSALVYAYSADHMPPQSTTKRYLVVKDTTDSNGEYRIHAQDTGYFNIEGIKDTLGVFLDSIHVPSKTTDTDVEDGIMKRLSSVKGTSHMPGLDDSNQVRINIYIPGTNRSASPSFGGRFTFRAIPEGNYSIYFVPFYPEYAIKVVDIFVTAGDTMDLDTVWIEISGSDSVIYLDTTEFNRIFPDDKWHNTHLNIEAGNLVILDAYGQITSPANGTFTPDGSAGFGDSTFLLLNQLTYALYGRVGSGRPFKVGSLYSGIADNSGVLQFAINTQYDSVETCDTLGNCSTVFDSSRVESGSYVLDMILIKRN
jgi:hypothetical protein